jgi:hypothetical protein
MEISDQRRLCRVMGGGWIYEHRAVGTRVGLDLADHGRRNEAVISIHNDDCSNLLLQPPLAGAQNPTLSRHAAAAHHKHSQSNWVLVYVIAI